MLLCMQIQHFCALELVWVSFDNEIVIESENLHALATCWFVICFVIFTLLLVAKVEIKLNAVLAMDPSHVSPADKPDYLGVQLCQQTRLYFGLPQKIHAIRSRCQ
jgi:hypothetical protein